MKEFLDAQQEQLDEFQRDLGVKQAEWRRLAETQLGSADSREGIAGDEVPVEGDRRRETAMNDVRELKTRNAELQEKLDELLGEQSDNTLNADAVIRREREQLGQLQKEWREKLRQAEIEISLQRAKLARDKARIDERLRAIENQPPPPVDPDRQQEAKKRTRGRWLAKLGLGSEK